MTRLELPVRGLHCSGCEWSLEADQAARRLVVELLSGRADATAIRRRVEEAGFEVPE